jgi:hypothetical protein
MNNPKLITTLALAATFTFAALSAKAEPTVITFIIDNKTEHAITSSVPGAERVEPNSSKTFSYAQDLRIADMRDGSKSGFGRGVAFILGDKICGFNANIDLSKVNNHINVERQTKSESLGKQPVGCMIELAEESQKTPYNFNTKLVMVDFAK